MSKRNRVFRGDRLKAVREQRNISQEDLATALGMAQSQITRYENGKVDPSPEIIARLCTELEVTSDYLLGLVDEPDAHLEEKELSPLEQQVIAALRRSDILGILRLITEKGVE